jgi:hypothetical protein
VTITALERQMLRTLRYRGIAQPWGRKACPGDLETGTRLIVGCVSFVSR